MLTKRQILERLEALLTYKGIANATWYCEQIESLIVSANSPEPIETYEVTEDRRDRALDYHKPGH